MKFAKEILENCPKEFLYELEEQMKVLIQNKSIVYYTELFDYGYGSIPKKLIVDNSDYDIESEACGYCNDILPVLIKYSQCFKRPYDGPILDINIGGFNDCKIFAWNDDAELTPALWNPDDDVEDVHGVLYTNTARKFLSQEFLKDAAPAMQQLLATYNAVYFDNFRENDVYKTPTRIIVQDTESKAECLIEVQKLCEKYGPISDGGCEIDGVQFSVLPAIGTVYLLCKRTEEE